MNLRNILFIRILRDFHEYFCDYLAEDLILAKVSPKIFFWLVAQAVVQEYF